MQNNKLFQYLKALKPEPTAHQSGQKKVFLKNEDSDSTITQFAHGVFEPGESCEWHTHESMIESYYFIKGNGLYLIGEEKVTIKPETFCTIPANVKHRLINNGNEDLEFVYFGVEV